MWPGVRRAGLPRQSPALTPGQRRAQRAALIQYGLIRQRIALADRRGSRCDEPREPNRWPLRPEAKFAGLCPG